MSFEDLYLKNSPLISNPNESVQPSAFVFGVPFDSTHSFRPGARFGPDSIRLAFNNIEIFSNKLNVDLEDFGIKDLGNLHHTVEVNEMIEMVQKVTSEIVAKNKLVAIFGGEHSLTYGTYMSHKKETGFIVFDAHYDLRDSYAGSKFSHAAYLRRIVEKRGAENIIHVGARSFVKEELEFLKENRMVTISDNEIREGNGPKLVRQAVSNFENVYLSVDLDVLDPAYAPGVGNPESLGITSRELFDMIYAMKGKRISSIDVVELCPPYDNGSTAAVAAKLVAEVMALNFSN